MIPICEVIWCKRAHIHYAGRTPRKTFFCEFIMEVNRQKWWYLGSYSILETMKYYIYRLYQVHIYLELEHPPPTIKLNDTSL